MMRANGLDPPCQCLQARHEYAECDRIQQTSLVASQNSPSWVSVNDVKWTHAPRHQAECPNGGSKSQGYACEHDTRTSDSDMCSNNDGCDVRITNICRNGWIGQMTFAVILNC